MSDTERIIAQWVSGVPAVRDTHPGTGPSSPTGPTSRTVVVDTDDWIPVLVSSGLIDDEAALIHRGRTDASGVAGWRQTYVGTFTDPSSELIFGDGFRLRQTRYGLADFTCVDIPTAFVLVDEHDFSAFLRDADAAWATGTFANHVTHPLALLANLAALGAAAGHPGPDRRVFVDSAGAVSTSPFGSILGRAADGPGVVEDRWRAAHALEPVDAVALHHMMRGADRVEAINERPWLQRYFEVAAVLRSIRTENLQPGRVSGFGGRLTDQDRSGTWRLDHGGLPVLVEVGLSVRAVEPATGRWTVLPAELVTTAERLLDSSDGPAAHGVPELSAVLTAAGLGTAWLTAGPVPSSPAVPASPSSPAAPAEQR